MKKKEMRELKFRIGIKSSNGFRYLDKGELINLYRLNPWDGSLIVKDNGLNVVVPKESYIVEQYTGLKDKNGKEIYEGDILENRSSISVVEFSTEDVGSCGCCVPEFWGTGFIISKNTSPENCEIIGNIYENPELLEKKE